MSTVYCSAKTAAKTKTKVLLKIGVPKKAIFASSGIECCSTAVLFSNRL